VIAAQPGGGVPSTTSLHASIEVVFLSIGA
jgi:hypothetical protein